LLLTLPSTTERGGLRLYLTRNVSLEMSEIGDANSRSLRSTRHHAY